MRKLTFQFLVLIAGVLAMMGCSVSPSRIGVPLDNTAMQVGVGFKILPKSDNFTVLRVAPMWFGDDFIAAVNLSGISTSDTTNGLALGGVLVADEGCGISAAAIDHNSGHIGIRIGGIVSGKQQGLQFALVNYCTADSHAVQFGLLNFVEGSPCPLPLLNWSWGESETP